MVKIHIIIKKKILKKYFVKVHNIMTNNGYISNILGEIVFLFHFWGLLPNLEARECNLSKIL